ncbi:NAD-dependent epimerase/dehydratase family protein [Temperatibacter marinus]|uniref:NAD-dependent epimerase/dehydratase family protein n=1 Tax=Temperatibacter marinus TaxID=1456591 RepID=A0AA52HAE7_9PROT|nr:NAD-dependent epimerase/dehydratase family protein [Temperatibacter marinus]WND03547.1 NAD-dependent epimerase/dehydratase family protein [Temperatibacter marinus]
MKVLILGMGHVGKALAAKLKSDGHTVVGTTTTSEKVETLQAHADEVHVLKGSESDRVKSAAQGCDAVVATVAPNVKNTRTKEEREVQYEEVLVKSCASAAAACGRVLFLSSFSVYGDGGPGDAPISEATPTSNHEEPSSKYYQAAEAKVLESAEGCVLRFPDMYGAPGDMDFPARVKMAADFFGGKILFGPDAPLYAIHFEDVVDAVYHSLSKELTGVFNVCDNANVPAANKIVFDAICDDIGIDRLEYMNAIKAPNRRISADKFYATGYSVQHGDPNADVVARHASS